MEQMQLGQVDLDLLRILGQRKNGQWITILHPDISSTIFPYLLMEISTSHRKYSVSFCVPYTWLIWLHKVEP